MGYIVIVAGTVLVLALCAGSHRWFRTRAARIERCDQPTAEQVHRLQRLALWQALAVAVSVVLAGGALGGGAAVLRHHHAGTGLKVVLLLAYLVCLAAIVLGVRGTVRPALARVRDVPVKPANRRRLLAVTIPAFLIIGVVMGIAFSLAPKHGAARIITLIAVYFVVVVVLQSLLAPLLLVGLRSQPLPSATRERLQELARRMGVRVDVRAFAGREQKTANAVQVGTIPRLRYVLVTDYLLDNLDDDEVDAVVAHEFGHLRGHHVLAKMLSVVLVWSVLETVLLVVRGGNSSGGAGWLVLPVAVAIPVGIVLVQGLVGVRLETRADDAAAAAVGADTLASALGKVGRLNDTKRNTGRGWSLLTQHPGLERRIRRLREFPEEVASSEPVPAGQRAAAQ